MAFQLNTQDRRSLALHSAVAERIAADPSLLRRVREKLGMWAARETQVPYYVTAWERILERPLPDLLRFLVEESEWAADLRQSSPFTAAGILTPRERWAILKRLDAHEAA